MGMAEKFAMAAGYVSPHPPITHLSLPLLKN